MLQVTLVVTDTSLSRSHCGNFRPYEIVERYRMLCRRNNAGVYRHKVTGDRNDYCVEKPLKEPSISWHAYSTKLRLYCIHHRLQCTKQLCVTGRLEVLSVEITDTDVNGRGF